MKKSFLVMLLLLISHSYAQSVNDYSAVIIPIKYDFLRQENQYRLNTLTKFNFTKAGFVAFYTKETIPEEYNNRCSLLRADVEKENGFLITKLYIVLKDCNDKVIFKSEVGKSNEKDYQVAYTEALNEAFQSVYKLQYKYSGAVAKSQPSVVQQMALSPAIVQKSTENPQSNAGSDDSNLLYAQTTTTGYQLIDNSPKVVMKLLKTSQPNFFIAIKDMVQGSLVLKDNQWYFEYYQNDKLMSEKVAVKF